MVLHWVNNSGDLGETQFTRCFRWLISLHYAEECLIDFAELVGSHSGENMADTVWTTLEKFGLLIVDFLHYTFVMDNATNNDTMVEALEQKCRKENIPFSSSRVRMRCMPHTVHLAAIKVGHQTFSRLF
ncbi:hypothetical protein B0H14DRAFT_2346720 [Mycena olivaceomarginata]|nr:hypothetical protein B0H14DRAFT_2346720 [Mycena olivaceomarginata]